MISLSSYDMLRESVMQKYNVIFCTFLGMYLNFFLYKHFDKSGSCRWACLFSHNFTTFTESFKIHEQNFSVIVKVL
jgi:hypothetical protein